MNSSVQYRISSPLAFAAICGLIAGFLYCSVILSIAFLLPVQVAYSRRGQKAGLAALGFTLLISILGELVLMALGGGLASIFAGKSILNSSVLLSILPPTVLLGSLAIMNLPFWKGISKYLRGFAATALASAVALPGLIALSRDSFFLATYKERLSTVINSFASQTVSSVDAEAFSSLFNVEDIARTSMSILFCSFAAILLIWLVGSRWLGNRISKLGSLDRQEVEVLADYRLPYLFVWPFLLAWTGVLGASYFRIGMPYLAIVWNLALVLSLGYSVQGLGIASHFLRQWNLPRSLKVCLVATFVLLIATPPIGTVLLGIIPVLGVTEVWIPYRNPKGVKS